jgi:hypothetical protein
MDARSRTVEQIIGEMASAAKGVVTRAELRTAEISRSEIAHRLDAGSLLIVFPGVYRVGHAAPSVEADYMAAVKACGEGSGIRGLAAAWLWDIVRGPAPPAEVVARTERRIKGTRTVRERKLDSRDLTTWRGIPVTTLARTLVDLAAALPEPALARAFHEANVKYRTEPEDVERILERRPNTKGAAALCRVVRGDTHVSLSRLESKFLQRLEHERLPLPITNRPAGGRYVDCRWPEHKLTVELDSYRYHATRHAWEQDHVRARQAYARGDEFRRYTWSDVFEGPRAMLRELRGLLSGPLS